MKEDVSLLGIPKTDASGRRIPWLARMRASTTCPSSRAEPSSPSRTLDPRTLGFTTRFVSILGADYGRLEYFTVFVRDDDGAHAAGLLCDSTHPFVRYNTFKGYWGDDALAGIELLAVGGGDLRELLRVTGTHVQRSCCGDEQA